MEWGWAATTLQARQTPEQRREDENVWDVCEETISHLETTWKLCKMCG